MTPAGWRRAGGAAPVTQGCGVGNSGAVVVVVEQRAENQEMLRAGRDSLEQTQRGPGVGTAK